MVEPRSAADTIRRARPTRHAGQGTDHSGRSDLPDRVVVRIRHVNVACRIRGKTRRVVESRHTRVATGPTGLARGSRQGTHDPCR